MEAFIMFCMIFGIMAPIFVPIAGGIVWGLFAAFKFFFISVMICGVLYLMFDWARTPKRKSRGTLLYERAQLEEERDRLVREKEDNNRPWPKTVRR